MKKDIAGMNQTIIQNKKETLEEIKKQIRENPAQQKMIIKTALEKSIVTLENSMSSFFTKQEESNKVIELARGNKKEEEQIIQIAKQIMEVKKKSKIRKKQKTITDSCNKTRNANTNNDRKIHGTNSKKKSLTNITNKNSPTTQKIRRNRRGDSVSPSF